MFRVFILILFFFSFNSGFPQSQDFSFISYGNLPTWTGVGVDWSSSPKVHIYDTKIYQGHAEFVSRGLGRKIRFNDFKKLARQSQNREFLPFFLYDLSSKPFINKSGSFNWAVRLENYNYDDKPAHLATEILKLVKMISELDKTFNGKGLIVLTEGDNNPLGVSKLGKFILKEGHSFITLNELIKYVGGKKMEVLNPGVAFGLVKFIKNEKELEALLPTDIAILNFIPLHIPPVSGIVSLKPQTPLSHVNLLAKNRGTFNGYVTDIFALQNLKSLIGKYAKLSNNGDKIIITKSSKKEVDENQKLNPRKQIIIPEARQDLTEVISLTKENEKFITTSHIGAKAANYYLLLQNLPDLTRPAFAIGFKYYFDTIKGEPETMIQNFLKEKDKFSKEEKSKALLKIRSAIEKSNSFPATLVTSIRKILEKYPPKTKIRLRSSTNNEDLPEFNGAGLYESKGFNSKDNDEKLKSKILSVYSSLWSDRAFFERDYFGIDHSKVGMAILIQEAFQKEVANGVIVTTGSDKKVQMIVNTQSGEHSVTSPEENILSESFLLNPESGSIEKIYSESSLSPVFIGTKTNELQLKKIQEATMKLHSILIKQRIDAGDKNKYGIDIEFKIMHEKGKNKLYFKQVRLLKY
ncbi:MAG TPA: PEP/pyruvate-binding domain-containing protein [Leptospiraceae bacterium]|nr:PEP/pyruvate-binding domain-containing protein [Leptospiraceae bacterium]HMW03463.1 PEP/pyruvate-binding domain-containing protein [Leptospiraceae bacterium]HMX31596.1 PEP/pyruvate-binding domain-containing protein [Leptospiraceae bacterium]HMY29617.1 PEP/pyruvate-binding domain-containing protein [Leptospiraceae bacterium]HMZ62893.1 PEP/pyruvate-binding domain-containing protein [Leptospiraceae bacterium]